MILAVNYTQLKQLWNYNLKTIQAWTGFNRMTFAIPVQWPAASWFDSSVGRALHPYCREHGFEFEAEILATT